MLHPDPSQRPTIDEVLAHAWLNECFTPETIEDAYQEMKSRKEYMQTNF